MTSTPRAGPGRRIGLLGGSFDPPHGGHAHITRWALRRFHLDAVWWLVSPGNPLKARGPADLSRRLAACQARLGEEWLGGRVTATDIEAALGTRYTAETLAGLRRLYPGRRFTWLMGADNLIEFHRWENWRWIMDNFPVGVLARPGAQARAGLSRAAVSYRRHRLRAVEAGGLSRRRAPAWVLLTGAMSAQSSTAIRARGDWP